MIDEIDLLGPSQVLNAFLLVLTSDGHISFVSSSVEKIIGLKQVDLLGLNIFEFSHPCDHNDLKEILSSNCHLTDGIPLGENKKKNLNSLLVRMKCTITDKGKTINLKSASYKVNSFILITFFLQVH
jgi:PREDICTED: hypoxia inducible factor, partial